MRSELDRARDALQYCDPSCSREEWVQLAMACKAAGIDFDTFDEWSHGGSSYDPKSTRSIWNSIREQGGVGPATLFKTAIACGWTPQDDEAAVERAAVPTTKPVQARQAPRASSVAVDVWKRCVEAPETHGYIVAKKGFAEGLRMLPVTDSLTIAGQRMGGALVVPVLPLNSSEPVSLQFIPAPGEGKKLNLPGAPLAGVFIFGEVETGATLYLCEGIGQAWACSIATGSASVVCFGWGRVRGVAALLRGRDASASLVLVPDVGKESDADLIARDIGCLYVTMPDGWERNADVNDLAQRDGRAALRRLLELPTKPLLDGVVLLNGADLTPEPIAWLWKHWLALGKLHILAGAPGQGKTTLALAMAATVTIGGRWPDGCRCDVGHVLIWSGEDDPADTLLPRLIAAGADRSRVHFVSGTRLNGQLQPFDPSSDMVQLEAQAARIGEVRLIIVDPVVSAVTGDSHKNTEVRRALQPLVDLASRLNASLVGISHFSKGGQGQDPTSRVVGSIAFGAVARVVLVAAKVKGEEGQDRRILARSKSNIGPDDGGFEYVIAQVEGMPGIPASRIEWGPAVEGSARELLTDPEEETDEGNAQDSAAAFLEEVLRAGAVPVKTVEAEAKDAGIAWRTIRRAADSLGIQKRRGLENRWYWSLPSLSKNPNLSNLSNVQMLDNVDNLKYPRAAGGYQ